MERVAMVLERESEVLEVLLFKLTEIGLLVEAGEARFLPRASREVERARTRAREVGLLRAATVAMVRPGATLRSLANESNGPWPVILRDHHDVLTRLLAEIEVAAHRNAVSAQAALERLSQNHDSRPTPARCASAAAPQLPNGSDVGPSLDHPRGRPVRDAELDHLTRGASLDAVLGTSARLHMPDLVDFLH